MRLDYPTEPSLSHKLVYDAFERKEYAVYTNFEPMRGGRPDTCWVTFPGGETQSCKSGAEFESLVKLLME
jgi:hypothetical protein